jgi:hypothetical protein
MSQFRYPDQKDPPNVSKRINTYRITYTTQKCIKLIRKEGSEYLLEAPVGADCSVSRYERQIPLKGPRSRRAPVEAEAPDICEKAPSPLPAQEASVRATSAIGSGPTICRRRFVGHA